MSTLVQLLQEVVTRGGSDLHIPSGSPPLMRFNGELFPLSDKPLTADESHDLMMSALKPEQQEALIELKNLDFAYEVETMDGMRRFRANAFYQRLGVDGSFRAISSTIPTLAELKIPDVVGSMVNHHQGLVLVTGPTGSGKTCTLSALLNIINETKPAHIITIEDPIEHIHAPKKCLINQRQVGLHTRSFSSALRAAMREDPDVILVGEMRDLETISLAITAAETGHLVLGTLHTSSAPKTIDRIIGAFPAGQQAQIRTMVSESVRGIVSQILIPSTTPGVRIPAIEILMGCVPVANVIREGKTFQIPSLMQTGRNLGMRSMDDALLDLLQKKQITSQDAYDYATDKKMFEGR
ncbi:MAG TPA: type IV pilus twitching motility protein PilT [Candidatus Xenobia bacterium]